MRPAALPHSSLGPLLLICVMSVAGGSTALAQASRPAVPAPRGAPPAASTPPAATVPHISPADEPINDPEHPPVLPPASRAKMSKCGREWQAMKRRGADRDMTWRQFATTCLVRD